MYNNTSSQQFNKEFNREFLKQNFHNGSEWLLYIGQPMLYDDMLYVTRRPFIYQQEYYRWVKMVRVA